MTTMENDEYTLQFDDSQEAKDRVFEIMKTWFLKVEMFSGESLGQSDKTYIEAPEVLSDVAENGFQFKRDWKE